jgi:hypothetical protein
MARELFAEIAGRSIEAASPLIATGKLAQLANGFLYDAGAGDPVFVHSQKIDWLRELVEGLDGEPLLIAYEFVEDLRTIRRAFGEVPVLGGLTGAREASRLVAEWNAGTLPLLAFIRPRRGTGSICSTAGRAWRGCHRVGRLSSPSRPSRGSTGRVNHAT